tara:strand:- start:2132 stop:2386 length:255 start_codon:yes stop_codon:yes gene_type:complete
MSRLTIAQTLNGLGVIGATFATAASLVGVIGVIVSTPAFCPHSVGPARCNAAGSNAALIAAYGLTAAGAAGLLLVAGQAVDPEA